METRHYWEENGHGVKYENYNSNDDFCRNGDGHLNFATGGAQSEDDGEYGSGYLKKGKVTRQDPMSHRIIEKRRRDRMNNCLADLSRLIPPDYLKKGRGRVEKTEIIEMAIKHLKYLQDRVNGGERQSEGSPLEHFQAGFQECMSELMRFLVDAHGYTPGDSLCASLVSHLHRHCDHIMKGEARSGKPAQRSHPSSASQSSSEMASSSSSQGYGGCGGAASVIQSRVAPECNNNEVQQPPYPLREPTPPAPMDCEPLSLDRKHDTLRTIRKPDHEDYLVNSYKFKNSIERRFSRSLDEAHDMTVRHPKLYKRRRAPIKHAPSTSTSTSVSAEDNGRDTSPPDSSDSPPNQPPATYPPPQDAKPPLVPVFALNALGKYYVPLNVEYGCLARYLGPYDLLDPRAAHVSAPLHPVTIYVNFQPYVDSSVKKEPLLERNWRPG